MRTRDFLKGMAAGVLAGTAMGMTAKCLVDKNERQIRKAADKVVRKARNKLDDLIGC